jgi:hypothetical protein
LWALGYFILIAPSSSIVAQADVMFEHRTYLPMICMAIALGFLLEHIPRAKLTVAFAVLIPVMLAGTISRNADLHDEKGSGRMSPQVAQQREGVARPGSPSTGTSPPGRSAT